MANGDLVKLGTLYINNIKQLNPTNPIKGGNIPNYSSGNIEIRDSDNDDNYKINWIKVTIGKNNLLIADRNILVGISWDTLNAQGLITGKDVIINGHNYKLRVLTGGSNFSNRDSGGTPTTNEWDKIIANNTNKTNLTNIAWNWQTCLSWNQERYSPDTTASIARGGSSVIHIDNIRSSSSEIGLGWRPVLESPNKNKFLIKQNNNYISIKPKFYNNGNYIPLTLEGGTIPNTNDFTNNGFDDLQNLLVENDKSSVVSIDKGNIGEGKYFSINFPSDFLGISNIR